MDQALVYRLDDMPDLAKKIIDGAMQHGFPIEGVIGIERAGVLLACEVASVVVYPADGFGDSSCYGISYGYRV